MEHEQQPDLYNQDHHYEHEMDASSLEVNYEDSYESHDPHEGPQDAQPQPDQPQPQPQQTYPANQQQFQPRSRIPPPSRAPPSLPPQQIQNQYPNQAYSNQPPRSYPPQANPQYYPQPGYASAHPVQAPPKNYQTQAIPQGYNKPQPNSPYNPNAGAPGGYQNGGYGAAAQGVQMHGQSAPGYTVQQSPFQMSSYGNRTGTVGWSTGLFDCMEDPTNALMTCCCPCFTFGQIAEIVDSGQTSCGTSGILYAVIAAFIAVPCLISCTYRTKMRNQYDLLELPAPDWLTHCLFECCALCQEYRELRNRGLDPALGWHGNMLRNQNMQQQPQVAMTPPVNQTMAGPNMGMR